MRRREALSLAMSRVERKEPVTLGEALRLFIGQSRLSAGLNTRRIFAAWDEASGASKYTLKKFYRNGILYVTTSSSVVCSQLEFQKRALVEKMNTILSEDEFFIKDSSDSDFIKELKLK